MGVRVILLDREYTDGELETVDFPGAVVEVGFPLFFSVFSFPLSLSRVRVCLSSLKR